MLPKALPQKTIFGLPICQFKLQFFYKTGRKFRFFSANFSSRQRAGNPERQIAFKLENEGVSQLLQAVNKKKSINGITLNIL
jgi:hypothetical protein